MQIYKFPSNSKPFLTNFPHIPPSQLQIPLPLPSLPPPLSSLPSPLPSLPPLKSCSCSLSTSLPLPFRLRVGTGLAGSRVPTRKRRGNQSAGGDQSAGGAVQSARGGAHRLREERIRARVSAGRREISRAISFIA